MAATEDARGVDDGLLATDGVSTETVGVAEEGAVPHADAATVLDGNCVPSMDPKGDAVGAEEAIDDSDELGEGETEREEKREGDNDTAGVYE